VSLTLATQPGFTDVPDTALNGGAAATSTNFKAINANAKYASVRQEIFWGFYKHGETVALPVSPADGYAYSRAELNYVWSVFWTAAPPTGALGGTHSLPTRGATSGQGTLLQFGANVDQTTGAITTEADYYKTQQMNTNDGILQVMTIATRDK
jgi:hypothetical protein